MSGVNEGGLGIAMIYKKSPTLWWGCTNLTITIKPYPIRQERYKLYSKGLVE
jgi:hypothetical protein